MLRSLRNKGPSHNSLFHESSNLSRTESLSTLQESSESFISRQCRRCAVCRVVGTISASCGFFELVPSGNRAKHHRRIADRIAEESSKQSGKKVVSLCMCLYACMHVCPSVCLSACVHSQYCSAHRYRDIHCWTNRSTVWQCKRQVFLPRCTLQPPLAEHSANQLTEGFAQSAQAFPGRGRD